MPIVIIAAIIMFFSCPSNVFSTTAELELLEKKLTTTNSLSGTFRQEYFDSLQNKASHSSGTFAFLQPGLMKWNYQVPEELEIYIGRDKIWIVDPALENVTIKRLDTVTDFTTLTSLFKPDQLKLQFKEIQTSRNLLDHDPNLIMIFLAPKKENPNAAEIQVAFRKNDIYIRQFVIVDKNLNYRKISFSKLDSARVFSPTDFEYTVPLGMEVIQEPENR